MKIPLESIPQAQRQRVEVSQERLRHLNNNDEHFHNHLQRTHYYFLAKFDHVYDVEVDAEFSVEFESYAADLIFQGYYLVLELLDDENTSVPADFLTLPNGRIKEMTFSILNGATEDLLNLLKNKDNSEFDKKLISSTENIASFLTQLKIDYACIGAAQALIDERYNRDLIIQEEPKEAYRGILTRSDDLFSVDPQKYLVCIASSPHGEVWRLYTSSTLPQSRVLGEVRINKFDSPREMLTSLPFYEEEEIPEQVDTALSIGITLYDDIPNHEQKAIENIITNALSKHTTNIQITVSQVDFIKFN
ncbi:hypothetical protein AB3N04_01070 (plasmid) [Alkalihalophilus sp. As8PL]|uniref:Uncharacterized protein n=1 Tax=Alkalihalophilus sp. As8PL TaxID=3237103 RepID=A0AB39BN36_9BACI